jgi:hypothetical protein
MTGLVSCFLTFSLGALAGSLYVTVMMFGPQAGRHQDNQPADSKWQPGNE